MWLPMWRIKLYIYFTTTVEADARAIHGELYSLQIDQRLKHVLELRGGARSSSRVWECGAGTPGSQVGFHPAVVSLADGATRYR